MLHSLGTCNQLGVNLRLQVVKYVTDCSSTEGFCHLSIPIWPSSILEIPPQHTTLQLHKTSYEQAKEWMSIIMLRPASNPTPYSQCPLCFPEYRIHISLYLSLLLFTGSPRRSLKFVIERVGWGNIGCIQPQRSSRGIVLHGWNAYA